MKYIKITLHGGASYIQALTEIATAVDGELDGLEIGDKITLDFEAIEMDEEAYKELPDSAGH